MKELNSLFRKSNGFKVIQTFLFPVLLSGAVACSSRIPVERDEVIAGELAANRSMPLVSVADTIKESWYELRPETGDAAPSTLKVSAKSCIDRKFVFGATVKVLGQNFDAAFEEDSDQLVLAMIEDSETKLNGINLPKGMKDNICTTTRSSNTSVIQIENLHFKNLQIAVSDALKKLIPDCRDISFEGRQAVCQLESMIPQVALVKTEEFQKSMIRKWSRQPYILARRTGVVSTLAQAATNISNDEAFVKFCRVLQFSLPEELPLVMTSRRWQSALCSGQTNSRREAAFYGLSKGTQELDMLRELYEGTSRVGVLSVRIPGSAMPTRPAEMIRQPLRVVISPDDQVSQNLVDQAKRYLGRDDKDLRSKKTLRSKRRSKSRKFYEVAKATQDPAPTPVPTAEMCWHPVFGETYGLLKTADGMKLTGKGFSSECGYIDEREEGAEAEVASLSQYLLHSLSSETEFVLDNGQSKLLRLPEGNYRYTVQLLPANPLDSEGVDEEDVPKTTGELNWDSTRRHAIRSW